MDAQPPSALVRGTRRRGWTENQIRTSLRGGVLTGKIRAWWVRSEGHRPIPSDDLPRLLIDTFDDMGQIDRTAHEMDEVNPAFFREPIVLSRLDWQEYFKTLRPSSGAGRPMKHDWATAAAIAAPQVWVGRLNASEAAEVVTAAFAEADVYPEGKDIQSFAKTISDQCDFLRRVRGREK